MLDNTQNSAEMRFFGTFRGVSRYVAKLSYLENPRYIYQYCIFFAKYLRISEKKCTFAAKTHPEKC